MDPMSGGMTPVNKLSDRSMLLNLRMEPFLKAFDLSRLKDSLQFVSAAVKGDQHGDVF
ncbi:hypothetical protein LINPERPRIM_LOCUS24192 [Linum perenne]